MGDQWVITYNAGRHSRLRRIRKNKPISSRGPGGTRIGATAGEARQEPNVRNKPNSQRADGMLSLLFEMSYDKSGCQQVRKNKANLPAGPVGPTGGSGKRRPADGSYLSCHPLGRLRLKKGDGRATIAGAVEVGRQKDNGWTDDR